MTDQSEIKMPRPWWKSFLIGVFLPAFLALGGAAIGAAISLLNGNANPNAIFSAVQLGMWGGMFISMFGVGEIAFGLLFTDGPRKDRGYTILGYLVIWSIILLIITNVP